MDDLVWRVFTILFNLKKVVSKHSSNNCLYAYDRQLRRFIHYSFVGISIMCKKSG
jgi:hypothetical protein